MSLPQPCSSLPNTPGRNPSKPAIQELRRSTPGIKDLITEIAADQSNLLTAQDSLLSRFVHPPVSTPRNKPRMKLSELFDTEDQNTELVKIYGFETRQAMLAIYSIEPHVSDDDIQEMLTAYGRIYWGYLLSYDETMHGYFGAYHRNATPKEITPEQTHTYFSILWPRHTKMPLLNRLRMLGQTGCSRLPFWVSLVGAIAAADYALGEGNLPIGVEKVAGMPAVFADLIHDYYHGGDKKPTMQEIQVMARFLAMPGENDPGNFEPTDVDPCGIAFFMQEFGKILWTLPALQSGARLFGFSNELSATYWTFSSIADYWLNMVSFNQIEISVAGMRVSYPDTFGGTIFGLWKQSVECEFWKIPSDALRYLQRYQRFSISDSPQTIVDGYDAAFGDALAEKLITEAQEHRIYAPVGAFRTALPAEVPIHRMQELCIWSDGTGLWVLPRPNGTIFYWRPHLTNSLLRCGLDNTELSAWNLILSALWHDLVTEGLKVIVRTGNDLPAPDIHHVKHISRKWHGRSRPVTRVLRLPSQRVIRLEGVHTWGTPEEIEKIKRQAHQVRGHRRRLLPGQQRSLYALENARRFNFIMPDGYTFVKPYQTGLSDPDAPATKETPILARGLASLMLMSKDDSKKRAA